MQKFSRKTQTLLHSGDVKVNNDLRIIRTFQNKFPLVTSTKKLIIPKVALNGITCRIRFSSGLVLTQSPS